MSAKYTFLAWDTHVNNASTKLALLQLANNADDNGFSYYSISKMAKACDMSERSFMRKIQELESMKVLIVERRANRPSFYTLVGDEMGVTICHLQNSEVTRCHGGVTICHGVSDNLSHDPKRDPDTDPDRLKHTEQNALLESGFEIFYCAGLVKKSKVQAFKKFKSLVNQMKADPIELGNLLAKDVQTRIAMQQYGIDKLHPSTYLNNHRWTDEHEEANNGKPAQVSRQSAAERIAARNEAKYGGSGLGMAASSGDLRGAVDAGERGAPFYDVVHSLEQTSAIDCEEWYQADN